MSYINSALLLALIGASTAAWATTPPAGTATPYNDIGLFDSSTSDLQSCVAMQDGQGNPVLDAGGKPQRYAVKLHLKNAQLEFSLASYAAFDSSSGKDCSGSFKNGIFSDKVLIKYAGDPLDGKVLSVMMDFIAGSNLEFRLRTDSQSFGIVRNFTGNSTALVSGSALGDFQFNSTRDFTNALPPTIKLKMPQCSDPQGDDNKVIVEKDGSVLFTATPGTDYTLNTSILPVGNYQLKAYCSDESAIRAIATAAGMTPNAAYFGISAYASGLLTLKVPASSSGSGGSGGTGGSGTGQLNFQFDSATLASDQQLIQAAANFARDFFTAQFGRTLQKTSTIITIATQSGGCASAGASAFTGSQNLTLCTGNFGWTVHDSLNKQKIIIHEMFHLLQFELKWLGNSTGISGPHWLIEGSAEYVGWLGIANFSNISPALPLGTARGCMAKQVASYAPGLPNLDSLVTAQQFTAGPVYQQSMLGVDELVSNSSVSALQTYGTALGNGTAVDAAFQTAFGTPLTTFYSQFPTYKAGLSVPSTDQCGT